MKKASDPMPKWSTKDERELRELWSKIKNRKGLRNLADILNRSPEAAVLKAKRLGLPLLEKS